MMKKNFLALACAGAISSGMVGLVAAAPEVSHVNGQLVVPRVKVVVANAAMKKIGGGDNVRAYLNPETGGIGGEPTAAEIQALNPQARHQGERAKAASSPRIVTSADGRFSGMNLSAFTDDADMMPYSVVRREADGSLRQMCVQGKAQADKFLRLHETAGVSNGR
jgi:hypothetical protein